MSRGKRFAFSRIARLSTSEAHSLPPPSLSLGLAVMRLSLLPSLSIPAPAFLFLSSVKRSGIDRSSSVKRSGIDR